MIWVCSFTLSNSKGANVEPWWDFVDLGAYAIRFRYEALPNGEDPLDRQHLLDSVRALIACVEELASSA
jgi:hypothetical protein